MVPITVEFSQKNLTGNAGLTQVGRFAEKLGLKSALNDTMTLERGANAQYQISDVIPMVIMGVLAGARHISHLDLLRHDAVLRDLFEWDAFPVGSTIGRLFQHFTHRHCQELAEVEDGLRQKVWGQQWKGRITLDLDSTVRGVSGHQEGAEKGYNPKKCGQPSYHPLLCFLGETRECFHNWFRPGNTHSANGSAEFVKECLARLPKSVWKVWCRADSAFFDGKLLNVLEASQCYYTIKVAMRGLTTLLEAQSWRGVNKHPGWEASVFQHRCGGWSRSRRFVAVRRRTETVNTEGLFPVTEVTYEYFCYVTTLSWTPWGIHRYYGQRATCENWIAWCKSQMAAGSVLTHAFWANSALFQTCLLAYNLLVWMLWVTQKHELREEPETIRGWLIRVPGKLAAHARKRVLKLPQDWWAKDRWMQLHETLTALQFA
jgi:hypothetical protein